MDAVATRPQGCTHHERNLVAKKLCGCVAVAGLFLTAGCRLNHNGHGELVSTGKMLGDWTMVVDNCKSGEPRHFQGVQLYDTDDARLAIWMMEDPEKGLTASVNSTTQSTAINLTSHECRVLSGAARPTSIVKDGVRELKGSYDIDCTIADSHVKGHVDFHSCH